MGTIFLELRPEVKVTVSVIRKQYATLRTPRCILTPNLLFLPQIIKAICSKPTTAQSDGQFENYMHQSQLWELKNVAPIINVKMFLENMNNIFLRKKSDLPYQQTIKVLCE